MFNYAFLIIKVELPIIIYLKTIEISQCQSFNYI